MSTVDNLIAFRVLHMLVTPFEDTDAFRFGIIDKDGHPLKKVKDLDSSEQRDSYTALHRLVFNLKKLLAKVPGGKSRLASMVAAYWLIKENYKSRTSIKEEELLEVIDLIESKNLCLVEEEVDINKFLEEEGGAIVNAVGATGAQVALDEPVIKAGAAKKKKTLQMFKRKDMENIK